MESFQVELGSCRGDIFQHLTLPSLTILQVVDSLYCDHPQLRRFISRSRPAITHLLLSSSTFSHEEVVATLALLPTITQLKLEGGLFQEWDPESMDGFLHRMTAGPELAEDFLLPNLMDLSLHFITQVKGRIGDVISMLESRRLAAHGLRQRLAVLRLIFWEASGSEEKLVRQRINVLRDGLDAQVMFI
ncbi:hypothetical protein Moror_3633 [Moniliophthora roreri MCA 2997]|uniref:Uncharacterized protein n=1 Tax=Moniliophthora roreri (strain MCA 2997) TaxID=1381753 RepID=V2WX14_MONRO|nr:hypothetical protein Moror_3633 [Moniliophthora roreri MCA 2997]